MTIDITATIGDTTVTPRFGTLRVGRALDERAECSFQVEDESGQWRFRRYDTVTINVDATTLFAGVVDIADERQMSDKLPLRIHKIKAVDWTVLADERIVARAYENTDVGTIVNDLLTEFLTDEGVTAGTIDTGPSVTEAVFNYVPLSRALEALAERANHWWRIDKDKQLHHAAREANVAPWTVTSDDVRRRGLKIEERGPKYRNQQYIIGGRDVTDPQTETFVGDGERKTFSVGFAVAHAPTVEVNDVAQTVGIRGLDSGRDFYWNKGSNEISQDDANTPLTSSDTLKTVYQGLFSIVAVSRDQDQIDKVVDRRGGTGLIDRVDEEKEISSRAAAFDVAAGKLDKFAKLGRKATFATNRDGLEPGQLVTVDLPTFGLDSVEMLIDSVESVDESTELMHTVVAVEGPVEGSWTRFFAEMSKLPDTLAFRENISEDEILTLLFPFSKTWEDTDPQPANFWFEVWPANDLATSATLYPQIDRDDWMGYVEWWDATTPLGRKQVTSRSLTASEIESTF